MTDEDELKRLLEEHNRIERPLRSEERARILARLGAHEGEEPAELRTGRAVPATIDAAGGPTDNGGVVDIGVSRSIERRFPLGIAAAIMALAAMGGLIVVLGNRGDPDGAVAAPAVSVIESTASTQLPAPPPSCPSGVLVFVAAVDAWDGIDRWAELIDERRPDPDLPTLAAAAIADWRTRDPSDPLLVGVEVEVAEPVSRSDETVAEFGARRAEPLLLAFDRMRLASTEPGGPLEQCAGEIETVAAELDLAAPDPPS